MSKKLVAYKKIFGKTSFKTVSLDKVIVSDYFPAPMATALYDPSIPKNSYIICPLYTAGDAQIGITGGLHKDEEAIVGMKREMAEETGMYPSSTSHMVLTYDGTHCCTRGGKYKRNICTKWSCYVLNLDKASLVQYPREIKGKDEKGRKVGCIIYGSEKSVFNCFQNKIQPYYSEDKLDGIMAIPYSFALTSIALKKFL